MNRNEGYKPQIGSNIPRPGDQFAMPYQATTYADLDRLNADIDRLIDMTSELLAELEQDLKNYDLLLFTEADPKLGEAHRIEWPKSLGSPSEAITYSYYKTLRLRNTASARYIRRRYEEAMRDVSGTVSLDLVILTNLIRNEVFLVQDFVQSTIKDVDDSSEFRVLEILQDWVQFGIRYAGSFRSLFTLRGERSISFREIENTTASEARQGQAVSKARLNSYNKLLVQEIESLQRSFAEFSEFFYNKHLKPAVDFRLGVGRNPRAGMTPIEREIESSAQVLNHTITMALTDSLSRKKIFSKKIHSALEYLEGQNRARNAVKELAHIGKPLPQSGSRVVANSGTADAYPEEAFSNAVSADSSTGRLDSAHSALSGLDEDDHPQYLLKSGGTLFGEIKLDDGALIDGIVPGAHRHTGIDGSPQINGADIIGGTLSEDVVNPDEKPPRPEDLEFVRYTGSANSGLVEATLSWFGDSRYSYEVQVARIGGEEE